MSPRALLAAALCLAAAGCGSRPADPQERVLRAEQASVLARGFTRAAESHLRLADLVARQPGLGDELRKAMADDVEAIDAFFASGADDSHGSVLDAQAMARLKAVRSQLAARLAAAPPAATPSSKQK